MPAWAAGVVTVLLWPVLFVPLLGYAVAATRSAAAADGAGPPAWGLTRGLLRDGLVVAAAMALVVAPFVLIGVPLSRVLHSPDLWRSQGTLLDVEAAVAAALMLALPWGIVSLLLLPHATARFAASGRAADMFAFATSLRGVRSDFPTWNVVIAAIVTAWAIGLACSALLCIGAVPGVFYAILVSAHATAALTPTSAHPPTR